MNRNIQTKLKKTGQKKRQLKPKICDYAEIYMISRTQQQNHKNVRAFSKGAIDLGA